MESKFTKSTDSQHKVTLESSIIYAVWTYSAAHGGTEAAFEVKTAFVGEGTKIKVKGKSEDGKNLGKISDVIYCNQYIGKLPIPEKIKRGDMVYFEVEFPQLGLSDESNHIPAGPPIDVKNMKWDKKEARRGDTLKLTADLVEVPDGSEVKVIIFEYDRDDIHDKIVELPATVKNKKIELLWEYEYHEDTDEIPTDEELKKYGSKYNPPEYFFVIDIDGIRFGEARESGLLMFKDYIEIELKTSDGKPVPNEDYDLTLPDGSTKSGKLDADGRAKVADIPPGKVTVAFPKINRSIEFN